VFDLALAVVKSILPERQRARAEKLKQKSWA